jgi:hypothetical protein
MRMVALSSSLFFISFYMSTTIENDKLVSLTTIFIFHSSSFFFLFWYIIVLYTILIHIFPLADVVNDYCKHHYNTLFKSNIQLLWIYVCVWTHKHHLWQGKSKRAIKILTNELCFLLYLFCNSGAIATRKKCIYICVYTMKSNTSYFSCTLQRDIIICHITRNNIHSGVLSICEWERPSFKKKD